MRHFLSISALPERLPTADITMMSLGEMEGGIGCGTVCVPCDAQGARVLGSLEKLSLCALGLTWVEQHSGAFAEKVHFLHFPDIQWYKKLLLGEGRVPQQSLCVKRDIFENEDQTVVSTIIITIKYNSIVESWS